MTLTARIKEHARELGFDLVGVAPAVPGPHSEFLDTWLARGNNAGMEWLARDPEKRKDPRLVLPGARSAVVCGAGCCPGDEPAESADPLHGIIARYARGDDYHDVLKEKLLSLLEFVRAESPAPVEGRAYVDTGPILEREIGALAGIGRVGKNTMLISRELGSYFLIGVLLLTVELEYDQPDTASICGRCTRCLDACPTGALAAPYELDARRCLSYLTIEHRGSLPEEARPAIGNRIFGCDICQEVCPWNRRARPAGLPALAPRPEAQAPPLLDLVRMGQEEFSRRFRRSAVKRAKRQGLVRNAIVALGCAGDPSAAPSLTDALADDDPAVREHAAWALGRLGVNEVNG